MDYLYDVFISYRRHREWTPWTREHVRNLLDAYLTPEMGNPPNLFVDEEIEPGADWPHRLGDALARSRVMVAIFSGDYFGSDWCLHELDLMYARLLRFPDSRLIIPVLGHDGEMIPDEIDRIQRFDLSRFRNTDLQRRTPLYQEFSDAIKKLAPHVAAAIGTAPPFEAEWRHECEARFDQVYKTPCCGPRVEVTKLHLKDRPRPTVPPRVKL